MKSLNCLLNYGTCILFLTFLEYWKRNIVVLSLHLTSNALLWMNMPSQGQWASKKWHNFQEVTSSAFYKEAAKQPSQCSSLSMNFHWVVFSLTDGDDDSVSTRITILSCIKKLNILNCRDMTDNGCQKQISPNLLLLTPFHTMSQYLLSPKPELFIKYCIYLLISSYQTNNSILLLLMLQILLI